MIKPEIFTFNKKYQGFDLKTTDKENYSSKLIDLMEREKIYLDPKLSLISLSKMISIPPPYLSRIVNEVFESNFCDFVNKYRIEESKQHLRKLTESKKTILEVAYTVGFNSKSTFYEAFKSQTGITPTQFLRDNFSKN